MLWEIPFLIILSGVLLYYQTNHELWSMRLLPVIIYIGHPLTLMKLYEYSIYVWLHYYPLPTSTSLSMSSTGMAVGDTTTNNYTNELVKPFMENLLLIIIIGIIQYRYYKTSLLLSLLYCSLSLYQGCSMVLCILIMLIINKSSSIIISSPDLSKSHHNPKLYLLIVGRSMVVIIVILYTSSSLSSLSLNEWLTMVSNPNDTIVLSIIKSFTNNLYNQLTLFTFQVNSIEPEMTPTWYLYTEIFMRTIPYFTIIIYSQIFFYAIPISIRLL